MGNIYFAVAHLTLCYVGPLVIIVLCYALICRLIWHRQIPGNETMNGVGERQAPLPQPPCLNRFRHRHHLGRRHRYGGVENQLNLQKAKLRALKMLVVVVAAFALSWLPLYATFTRLKFTDDMSEPEANFWRMMVPIAQWLSSANSCVNPFLYHFLDPRFRTGFRKLLCSNQRPTGRSVTNNHQGNSSLLRMRFNVQPTTVIQQRYEDEWV